jgi:hypothetical protein
MNKNRYVSASYVTSHILSVGSTPSNIRMSGFISGDGWLFTTPASITVSAGAAVSLAAPSTASGDYTFSHWSGCSSSTNQTISFSMPSSNISCWANYTEFIEVDPVWGIGFCSVFPASVPGFRGCGYARVDPILGLVNSQTGTIGPNWDLTEDAYYITDSCSHFDFERNVYSSAGENMFFNDGSAPDGAGCCIYNGKRSGINCNWISLCGIWDKSQNQCINCSATRENEILGNTSEFFTNATHRGKDGNGLCESACGADVRCDEVKPGERGRCPTGQACNDNCYCAKPKGEEHMLTIGSTPTGIHMVAFIDGDGWVFTTLASIPVSEGSTIDLIAPEIGPDGYIFSHWSDCSSSSDPAIHFTMPSSNTRCWAVYTKPDPVPPSDTTHTLYVKSIPIQDVGIGGLRGYTGRTDYEISDIAHGTRIRLKAGETAVEEPYIYYFQRWTGSGCEIISSHSPETIRFDINSDMTCTAEYGDKTYCCDPEGYALTVKSTISIGDTTTYINGVPISGNPSEYGATTEYEIEDIPCKTSFSLTALPTHTFEGTTYEFGFWSGNGCASSSQTASVSSMNSDLTCTANYWAEAPLIPPSTPTAQCQTIDSSQIQVSWSSVDGADGYEVYRCQGTTCTPTSSVKRTTSTSWIDTGLSANTSYSYSVKAYNSAGDSDYSNIVTCTTDADIPPTEYTLSVSIGGTGSGTVTSSPGDINCESTCFASLDSGTSLALTAAPGTAAISDGWGPPPVGGEESCDCFASFDSGISVTLTAAADAGSTFAEWSGACSGTDTSCTVTMNADKSVTAIFNTETPDTYDLTISSTAGGSTTPSEGIHTYDAGTVVDLVAVATPGSDYYFDEWTGDIGTIANVNAASTTITMNNNYSITANFGYPKPTARVTSPALPEDPENPKDEEYLTKDFSAGFLYETASGVPKLATCTFTVTSGGAESRTGSCFCSGESLKTCSKTITVNLKIEEGEDPPAGSCHPFCDCRHRGAKSCTISVQATDQAGVTSATDSRTYPVDWDPGGASEGP